MSDLHARKDGKEAIMPKRNYKETVIKKGGKVFGTDYVCLNCDNFCHKKGTDEGYCYEGDSKVYIRDKCDSFWFRMEH